MDGGDTQSDCISSTSRCFMKVSVFVRGIGDSGEIGSFGHCVCYVFDAGMQWCVGDCVWNFRSVVVAAILRFS